MDQSLLAETKEFADALSKLTETERVLLRGVLVGIELARDQPQAS